jgi:hypothetical protein
MLDLFSSGNQLPIHPNHQSKGSVLFLLVDHGVVCSKVVKRGLLELLYAQNRNPSLNKATESDIH